MASSISASRSPISGRRRGRLIRTQEQSFVRELALGDPDSRIWTDDGKDHVGSARAAYGDERIYAWLLRHVR